MGRRPALERLPVRGGPVTALWAADKSRPVPRRRYHPDGSRPRRAARWPPPPCSRWTSASPGSGAMDPQDRSWVGLVAQAGIAAFLDWYAADGGGGPRVSADVFGTAPRELTRSVTLQQTLDLLRTVVDSRRGARAEPRRARRGAATARGGAALLAARSPSPPPRSTPRPPRPAARGTPGWRPWSSTPCCAARPTTSLQSRAAALGWARSRPGGGGGRQHPAGRRGDGRRTTLRRAAAARLGADALAGVQGDRLVVVLGGAGRPARARPRRWPAFGAGPGRRRARRPAPFADAGRSARAALAGHRRRARLARRAPPGAADDLLPERAARRRPAGPRHAGRPDLPAARRGRRRRCSTPCGLPGDRRSLEGTARQLFVHPNTVRYRLRRRRQGDRLRPRRPAGRASCCTVRARRLGRARRTAPTAVAVDPRSL